MSSNWTSDQEKSYNPQDTTLVFVDGEDDLDFLCKDYKSLRAKMSCGHAVTPMSLTDWCRRLLDKGECRFVCGFTGCDAEWPFEEVCKMALLTPEEKEYFEKKMLSNADRVKLCPGCKSSVVRTDLHDLRVKCTVCTAVRKRSYTFCWQCLREWKGPAPRSDRCENNGCINQQLEILKNCPDIVFKNVRGVTGCPCIRACPTCGLLLEHNRAQCKNVVCPRCKVEFCFVCLKLTIECEELIHEELIHEELIREEPTDEEPTDEEPTDEEPTDEEPTDECEELTDECEKLTDECEKPTDECEKPTDEELTDECEKPTDEEPTDEEPTDEEPTDEELTDEELTDEELTDEELTDEELTDEWEEDDMYPYYTLCSSGVAPRQTSIPVWQRK